MLARQTQRLLCQHQKALASVCSFAVGGSIETDNLNKQPGVPPFHPPTPPEYRNPDTRDLPADSLELDPRRTRDVLPGEDNEPPLKEPQYSPGDVNPGTGTSRPSQFLPGQDIPGPVTEPFPKQ